MSEKLQITKKELLSGDILNPATSQALAEKEIIQESLDYFKNNKIDIKKFEGDKNDDRSNDTIIIKNLPYFVSYQDVQEIV